MSYLKQNQNKFYSKTKLDQMDNQCCSNPHIVLNDDTEYVCVNCGLVLGRYLSNSERRAYNIEEINNRRRTEPLWRSFGNRTVIGTINQDIHGKHIHPQKQALFSRLSKIQGSLINSLERNYWEAKPRLISLGNRLSIPDFVVETAWKIYKRAAKEKLTMGRSIEGFITASLYAAIRIHKYPCLLEEVVELSMLPLRTIHKSLALIVRQILPGLNLRYRPIKEELLIHKFANELDLPMPIQQDARRLLFHAKNRGLNRIGKDPKGIAGAVLYLAAKDTKSHCTQSNIAHVAHITEVTLRTRAKQIAKYKTI